MRKNSWIIGLAIVFVIFAVFMGCQKNQPMTENPTPPPAQVNEQPTTPPPAATQAPTTGEEAAPQPGATTQEGEKPATDVQSQQAPQPGAAAPATGAPEAPQGENAEGK